MKPKLLAIALLIVAGCASQPQRTAAPALPSPALAEQVIVPPPTPEPPRVIWPPRVQAAIDHHQKTGQWSTYRLPSSVLYPYNENDQPLVACAPLRTTDIQLAAGETITDVAMGDSERWIATPASSGNPRNPTPHLAVKPQMPGIETNLTIYTTVRIYHLTLRSGGRALQEVQFYYPEQIMQEISEEASRPTTNSANNNQSEPARFDFAYQVIGPDVPWKPVRAFDDGSRVYVQMPEAMKNSDAPALMVQAGSGTQMLNYRLSGNDTYVTDRLFEKAVLVAGVGRDQDRVTIAYTGAQR
jgi:P-type conjugative transfer protein TrbG